MEERDIISIAKGLKDQFVFALSLGDKELFHSNILAWFLEHCGSKEFAQVSALFGMVDCTVEKVWREEFNFDLLIQYHSNTKPEEKNFVLIENKFKSVPRREQLDEYRGKVSDGKHSLDNVKLCIENTKLFLLAPRKSIDCACAKMPEGWSAISYEDMLNAFPTEVQSSMLAKSFLAEYKKMMEDLLQIVSHAVTSASDKFSPCIISDKLLSALEEVRAHDIYQKLFFSEMEDTLGIQRPKWECENLYNRGPYLKWKFVKGNIIYGIQIQQKGSSFSFNVFAESEHKMPQELPDETELRAILEKWISVAFDKTDVKQKKDGTLNCFYGWHKYIYALVPAGTSIDTLQKKIVSVIEAIEKK